MERYIQGHHDKVNTSIMPYYRGSNEGIMMYDEI